MDINSPKYCLGEGEFTERDSLIRDTAQELRAGTLDYLARITNLISQGFELDRNIPKRTRTASEILESRKVTGCTDEGLVFLALARECGIPARYVETLQEDWIVGLIPKDPIEGHIFADVFTEGQWRVYDPKKGFTPNNEYIGEGRFYVPVGRGLDFGELDNSKGLVNRAYLLSFRKR